MTIKLIDDTELYSNFTLSLFFMCNDSYMTVTSTSDVFKTAVTKLSKQTNSPTAFIYKINEYGLVQIRFNASMLVPERPYLI